MPPALRSLAIACTIPSLSAGAVSHMKSLDGVAFSFFWSIGALLKDEGRARLLDLETNDRLRFIVEHVRRTLAG